MQEWKYLEQAIVNSNLRLTLLYIQSGNRTLGSAEFVP